MERYILKYLMDSTQDEWRKRYYDYMKLPLDRYFWSNGLHHFHNLELERFNRDHIIIPRKGIYKDVWIRIKRAIRKKIEKSKLKFLEKLNEKKIEPINTCNYKYNVLSLFADPYLTSEDIASLNELNIGIDIIEDEHKEWSGTVRQLFRWLENVEYKTFSELISDKYVNELHSIYQDLLHVFLNTKYDAVLVHTAERFETKIFIDIFRELGRPSLELMHGIPATNPKIEDRVDYLLVYGEKIKENCLQFGFEPERVYVAGNGHYLNTSIQKSSKLRCSYEDILIITSAPFAPHHHEWEFDKFPIFDRSLLVTYLYNVEDVLKRKGISHVRLRPHPTVNKKWLMKYLDEDFYEMDYLPLEESLQKATCCIGQNSTTVFEAILQGVSYMVYEPWVKKDSNFIFLPPFDGSDVYMRIANTEEQLSEMIETHYCPDVRILDEYMECFKPDVIKEILDKNCKI